MGMNYKKIMLGCLVVGILTSVPTINIEQDSIGSFAGVFSVTNINSKNISIKPVEITVVAEPEEIEVVLEPTVISSVVIPNYSGFKSYESYKAITNSNSKQYYLTRSSDSNSKGLLVLNNRYLVAVGTGTGANVGDYIDLILQNGTKIACVVGDIKDNSHTDASNLITVHSNCASEFIVNVDALDSKIKQMGDVSCAYENWDSPVCTIEVYDKNIFTEVNDGY